MSPPPSTNKLCHWPGITEWMHMARGVWSQNMPYLLPLLDSSAGADDNFVSSLKSDHLSHAVGRTWMVDVPMKEEWDRWNLLGKSIPWGKSEPNLRMALAPWAHRLSTYNYITLYLFLYLENVKKIKCQKNQGSKKIPFVTAAMKCNWKMSKADGRDSGTAWRLNVPAQRINPTNSEPPAAQANTGDAPGGGQGSLQGHPPCRASRQGGIDDVVVVNAEHVHATVLKDTSGTRTLVRFHCIASDQPTTLASSKCPPAFQIRHCPLAPQGKPCVPMGLWGMLINTNLWTIQFSLRASYCLSSGIFASQTGTNWYNAIWLHKGNGFKFKKFPLETEVLTCLPELCPLEQRMCPPYLARLLWDLLNIEILW